MKTIKSLALLIALGLSACQPSLKLAGTKWTLVSYGNLYNSIPALPGDLSTLEFLMEGNVSIQAGCNTGSGKYKTAGNTLEFTELAITMMTCADTNRMNQETAFLEALRKAKEFNLNGNQLILYYDDGTKALTFSAMP